MIVTALSEKVQTVSSGQLLSRTPRELIGAVIVTYHPPAEILENIAALRSQVESIVVVDNGSGDADLDSLRGARSKYDFELIENGRNLGIASALNLGVRKIGSNGGSWVVLFDQDSRIEPGFIDAMLETVRSVPGSTKVGIVCPVYLDEQTATALPLLRSKNGQILTAMTSGSFVRIELFEQVGHFNESLFVDYVDIEYCLRTRKAGYTIIQCPRAALNHNQGRITRHHVLGRWVATTNHSAARRYYITRNRLWVLGKFLKDWAWARQEIRCLFSETAKIFLLEQDRWSKLKGIGIGAFDAFRGKLGNRCSL
jgi:rhamnosyltransferase